MAQGGGLILGLGALVVGGLLLFSKKAKATPGGQPSGVSSGYPWGVYSPDTLALQNEINAWLGEHGLAKISADGKLGGQTCGAATYISNQEGGIATVPTTCKEYTWVPTAAGGKTYDQWNNDIEVTYQNALASENPQTWQSGANKLNSLNPPFPDLAVRAHKYAFELEAMVAQYYHSQAQPGVGGGFGG